MICLSIDENRVLKSSSIIVLLSVSSYMAITYIEVLLCWVYMYLQLLYKNTQRGHTPPSALITGFSGGSVGKNPPTSAGDGGLILGLGRSLGGGNGNPLQYSCLGNPMDRGAWRVTVHGVSESHTRLSD